MNKIILVGRLGRDSELKSTQSGTDLLKFSIAVDDSWKDREGNKQERAHWFDCALWGKRATDQSQRMLRKGSLVLIEGKMQSRKHEGVTYWTVNVDTWRLLVRPKGSSDGPPADHSQAEDDAHREAESHAHDDDFDF